MGGNKLSLQLADVEVCVGWSKPCSGRHMNEIALGHALSPPSQHRDNLQTSRFQSLQIRTGLSLLLQEKPSKYISAMRNKGCLL